MATQLKIGITCGDVNGIGTEVVIKALQNKRILNSITPVIYASAALMNHYKNTINSARMFKFHVVSSVDEVEHGQVNVVSCWTDEFEVQPGVRNNEVARFAYKSIKQAIEDHKAGKIHAVMTSPIDKHLMMQAGFEYPGHTEYLGDNYDGTPLMLLTSDILRVAVVTSHIALAEVPSKLSKERVYKVIKQVDAALRRDFGHGKPLIAVLGLNPHAGDQGRFGSEETDIIRPAVLKAKDDGMLAMGPFPSDGFFASGDYRKFDAIVAMYHDQGLIPFKVIAGHRGVNFTAGLDVVRTSPDHGTAFSLAGKDQADHQSTLHALFTAVDVVKSRSTDDEDKKIK